MGTKQKKNIKGELAGSQTVKGLRNLAWLLENRNLTMLFSGQMVSQIGDSLYQIGLIWLVLEFTGSKSATGIVAMVSHLPVLLFGLIGGVLVDRFNRRNVMAVSDALRALVVLIIPLSYYLDALSTALIITVSFVMSSLSTVFNPARDSLVPDLVKANSLVQVTNYFAIFAGPALGAAILGIIGIAHLFTIDAATFLVSFVAIMFIAYRPVVTADQGKKGAVGLRGQLLEILRYVRAEKRLAWLLVLTAVNNFFIMGPAIVGTPIFVKEVLNQGASSYALVESSLGFGMILGSILVNYLTKSLGKGKILLLGMIFDGVTYAMVLFTGSLPLFMTLIAFHAIGIPHIVVSRTSIIQEWTDADKLGRVFSLTNMAVVGMTALTTGATGWLAEFVGIEIIFGVFGILGMTCGIIGWLNPDLRNSA